MMKRIFLLLTLLCSLGTNAQSVEGTELGIDASFYASNLGGSFGLGAKYGWKFGEYIITGPSLRYQRTWGNNYYTNTTSGFNVYGGGAFIHARFFNALFVGSEIEFLRSPFSNSGYLTNDGNWVPTVLIGGGFSMEINESWRLNAGVMYDIVNKPNSPLQSQYFMRNANNVLIPIIYRIAFFFPIG